LDSTSYLARHSVSVYLIDALRLVLDNREDPPMETLADYFTSAANGTHVVQRDYSFVTATTLNRQAFAHIMDQALKGFPPDRLFARDYVQLLRLVCPDFPSVVPEQVARLLGMNAGHTGGKDYSLPPSEFVGALRSLLVYQEFWRDAAQVFQACDTTAAGSISRQVFYLALKEVRLEPRSYPSFPPVHVLERILLPSPASARESITFQGFFAEMAASHLVKEAIDAEHGAHRFPAHFSPLPVQREPRPAGEPGQPQPTSSRGETKKNKAANKK
jgi:hypothetical protein